MTLIGRMKSSAGLTLIETLASLLIFSIITLGIIPLLAGSLQGAATSRSTTVAKAIAQKAMERARGLPYFLSIAAQPSRVDMLDIYYPDDAPAGANTAYAGGKFTTICPGAATPRACPQGIPAGYTLTVEAEFVRPGAINASGQETFLVIPPPTGYAWNAANTLDQPATQLLRFSVIANWTVNGTPRTLRLSTLVGNRKLGEDKLRGFGRVDHTIEVLTSFRDGATTDDLVAVAGTTDSRIETRILSAAEVTTRTGQGRLVQNDAAGGEAIELSSYTGPTSLLRAPADVNPGPVVSDDSEAGNTISHPTNPSVGSTAFYDTGRTVAPLQAVVSTGFPVAQGGFEMDSAGLTGLDEGFWVDNQALTGSVSPLLLDPTNPVFYVQKKATGERTMFGSSSAVAGNPVTDKRVQTSATLTVGRANLFPVLYTPANTGLVRITSYTSSVDCKTTGTTPGAVSATYSAKLEFFRELNPNDGLTAGQYVKPIVGGTTTSDISNLTLANTSDPLAAFFKPTSVIQGPLANHPDATNPMVREAPLDTGVNGNEDDIYLFPVIHEHVAGTYQPATETTPEVCAVGCHKHDGYLEVWRSKFGAPDATLSSDGRNASARIDGGLSITTVPSDPAIPSSGLVISFGKISCDAVDNR